MGCDIHLHVEVRSRKTKKEHNDSKWYSDEFYGEFSDRNYNMFSALADVRNDGDIERIVPERGLPTDGLAFATEDHYYLTITDDKELIEWGERYCSRENAEKWVSAGYSVRNPNNENMVSGPDWHSENWCTADELKECIDYLDNNPEFHVNVAWKALYAYMKAYEENGYECRAVYWFDN